MNDIPIVFPLIDMRETEYRNLSELKRFNKVTDMFNRLKYFIENDRENELFYLKEFLNKNGIYDEEYFTIEKLMSFSSFLFSDDRKINISKTIQQIIIDSTNPDSIYNNMLKIKKSNKASKEKEFHEEYDFYNLNKTQTKVCSNVFKKIKAQFNDPKLLIESLEHELLAIKENKLFDKVKFKNKQYNFELDICLSSKEMKQKIDHIKKKHKLLEYIILQKSKNKLNNE